MGAKMRPKGHIRLLITLKSQGDMDEEAQYNIKDAFSRCALNSTFNVSELDFERAKESMMSFVLDYPINFNPIKAINSLKSTSSRDIMCACKDPFWKPGYWYQSLDASLLW